MEDEKKREGRRRLLRGLSIAGAAAGGGLLALFLGTAVYFHFLAVPLGSSLGVIGGADGPTAIFVAAGSFDPAALALVPAAVFGLSVFGLCKTRKK